MERVAEAVQALQRLTAVRAAQGNSPAVAAAAAARHKPASMLARVVSAAPAWCV